MDEGYLDEAIERTRAALNASLPFAQSDRRK